MQPTLDGWCKESSRAVTHQRQQGLQCKPYPLSPIPYHAVIPEDGMKVKSTLKVINQKDYKGRRGVTDGQTYQRLVGWPEVFMTDRVRLGRATYKPGTYEQLHWHPIEACYYVISGHATVRDFERQGIPSRRRLHHLRAARHRGRPRVGGQGIAGAPGHTRDQRNQPQDPVHGRQEDQAVLHRSRRTSRIARRSASSRITEIRVTSVEVSRSWAAKLYRQGRQGHEGTEKPYRKGREGICIRKSKARNKNAKITPRAVLDTPSELDFPGKAL